VILSKHIEPQHLDIEVGRCRHQELDKKSTDAPMLVAIDHRERSFGRGWIVVTDESGGPDSKLGLVRIGIGHDPSKMVLVVDVGQALGHGPGHAGRSGEEPEVARFMRQLGVGRHETVNVGNPDRANPHASAVAQLQHDPVGGQGDFPFGAHALMLAAPGAEPECDVGRHTSARVTA